MPAEGPGSYRSVVVGGVRSGDAASHYQEPEDATREIADRMAFCKGVNVEDLA